MRHCFSTFLLLVWGVVAYGIINWRTNYEQALEEAMAQHKKIFLLFTGSDWCNYCITLDSKILSTPQFEEFADTELIPVKIDFPRKHPMMPFQRQYNENLSRKFGVKGYPSIFIINETDQVLSLMEERSGIPAELKE